MDYKIYFKAIAKALGLLFLCTLSCYLSSIVFKFEVTTELIATVYCFWTAVILFYYKEDNALR